MGKSEGIIFCVFSSKNDINKRVDEDVGKYRAKIIDRGDNRNEEKESSYDKLIVAAGYKI